MTDANNKSIFIELIAVVTNEEIVNAHDGDDAIMMIESNFERNIHDGDDLIRVNISHTEQIHLHQFYIAVEATIRRVITIRDGLMSDGLSSLINEIQKFERAYSGNVTVFINKYWVRSE